MRYGFTPSGLARSAGLDATTFNRSKRIGPDGRERWPSTESIAILGATGASLDEFMSVVMHRGAAPARTIPLLGFAQAGLGGFFEGSGLPAGSGWEEVASPACPTRRPMRLRLQATRCCRSTVMATSSSLLPRPL
ncbi:putative transcriptional regulator [Bosea sp. LC85]|nr:putative transcriptional regulator [Bosea sp. LC85]